MASPGEDRESSEQQEFREYARRWLAENRPAAPSFRLPISPLEVMTEEQCRWLQAWQRKCWEAGLVGSDYPKAYGGAGYKGFQRIAAQELTRAKVPFLVNIIGLSMAAPTILHHGTEEQKKRFLPGCLSADEIWCQGFSEPGAGSDLANAQTTAVKDGDEWVLNGHKVWTTLGRFASWMILLARTGRDDKYKGLTYYLCPIAGHPGVTVRPLIKITGETGFNEVLFDDARIPDSLRLDEVGAGWTVAMTTLLHERGAAESAGSGYTIGDTVERLVALAKRTERDGRKVSDDPLIRDALVRHAIDGVGIRENARRARVPGLNDHPMRVALQMKLLSSEWAQSCAHLGMEIEGLGSSLYLGDENAADEAYWPLAYMNSYGMTIAAGTNEIQRNILGERVLNLPKSK
ncbi:MAG: acyl-CoA dehydrogenase family protein [Polyangiales bacterium]